jgi:hypothetical protein
LKEVIVLQEDLEQKTVALTIKTGKLTAQALAKAMRAAYQQIQKARDAPGQMSFKQLSKGGTLSEVDITHDNIKAFDPVARKYGIRYSLQKDVSTDPPLWKVYFRAKDADSMTAAFREFSAQMLNRDADKPSVREQMRELGEKVANAVREITKKLVRGGPDL